MPNPYDPPNANVLAAESAPKVSRAVGLAANTLFRRTLDGRIVFRPWGKFGACYLPDEQQQLRRARGLPRTEAPVAALTTRNQHRSLAREHLRERGRLMGKPMLWTMLVMSLIFVLGGITIAATGGSLMTAAGAILFFGACAIVFAWQLRSL